MRLNYEKDYELDTEIKMIKDQSLNSFANTPLSKSLVLDQNEGSNTGRKMDLFHLRKLITKHKVKILTTSFINKLRQTNTNRKPPQQQNLLFQQTDLNFYLNFMKNLQTTKGIKLNNIALTIWSFINIIQITLMVFIFSINIAFRQTQDYSLFVKFRIFSVILYIFDIVLNFITQRYQSGRQIVNIRQIGQFYFQNGLFIDFINIIMFFLDLVTNMDVIIILMMISLLKLWNSIKMFQKFSYLYVKTTQKQHYYGLMKVFLTNFFIGHILSICLNMIATINPQHNWYNILNISQAQWPIRYVWGYYWGTNIMLTVGFGDLTATTYTQAILLIFIQTFSCITLAYNISTVGSLMSQLKSKDELKRKQMKIFHRMSEDNQINRQLTTRISNFIQQSFQIRETFQFQQEDKLLASLPKGIQSEFRIQANKILFDNIGFLNNMSSKTLVNLAQTIERKISHPQEIIKKKGSLANFMTLSNGQIGLCCRWTSSVLNGQVIQKINVQKNQKPKLISMDFIKGRSFEYDVKSLGYTISYFLQRDQFMQCLKDFQLDYQFFCVMRDRDEYLSDQNQLYKCSICKNLFHNKFKCNRLHYIPIRQHIIRKNTLKRHSCKRQSISRPLRKVDAYKYPLRILNLLHQEYQRFLTLNFGKMYIQKLNMSKRYFQKTVKFKQIENQRAKKMGQSAFRELQFNQRGRRKLNQSGVSDQGKDNVQVNSYDKIQKLLMITKEDHNLYRGLWDLQVDIICNFKYYFTSFNAERWCNNGKLKKDKFFNFL